MADDSSQNPNEFIVGEFFNEENLKIKVFPFGFMIGRLFINKLVVPNQEKIIKINKNLGKLQACNLPEPLNGTETQKYAQSIPLTEDELFQVLYLLICDYQKPDAKECLSILGTMYYHTVMHHFHVKTSRGELLTTSLSDHCDHQCPFSLNANEFDSGVAGGMFCYLKTI